MSDETRPIRVVIADGHEVVRAALAIFFAAFAPEVELVGEAASGEEAVQVCVELQPDVMLLDVALPGMDNLCTTRAVCQACPQTRVVVLTALHNLGLRDELLQAGAADCLLKDLSATQLLDAIHLAFLFVPPPPLEI